MTTARKAISFLLAAAVGLQPLGATADTYYYRQVKPRLADPQDSPATPNSTPPGATQNDVPESVRGTGDLAIYAPLQLRARPGVTFALQLSATGGSSPLTWNSVGSPFPAGISLDAYGLVTGTPTQVGTAGDLRVQAVDPDGKQGTTRTFTIDVKALPTVAVASVQATAGQSLNVVPVADNIYGSRTWRLTGDLPVGASLNAATGQITGTVEQPGTFGNLVLSVTDSDGASGQSAPFSITVASNLVISGLRSDYLARQGRTFNAIRPTATGMQGPFAWSMSTLNGTDPAGLSIDASTGVVSGTPTFSGLSRVVIRVTDTPSGTRIASNPVSVTAGDKPSISVGSAYYARVGQPLSILPQAANVLGGGYWTLAGSPPSGISVDTSTGAVTGTVGAQGSFAGLSLRVIDMFDGASATSAAFSIQTWPALVASAATASGAQVGTAFSIAAPTVSGLRGVAAFALDGGTLPPGLTFDTATGAISGTPTRAGSYGALRIRVTDTTDNATAYAVTSALTVVPAGAPVAFAVSGLSPSYPATVGRTFQVTPVATGAKGAVTWSVAGQIPPWASFDGATGTISGLPNSTGSANGIVLTATDAYNGSSANSPSFGIVTSPAAPLAVSAASYSVTQGQQSASTPAVVSNAVGSVTYALSSGSQLPDGMSLSSSTGSISGTPTGSGDYPGLAFQVTDGTGAFAVSAPFTLTVASGGPPGIGSNDAPSAGMSSAVAAVGQPFAATPTAVGMTAPLTWSLAAGTLPPWASLAPDTGAIAGTPTATGIFASLALKAVDSTGRAVRSNSFDISVVQAPSLSASIDASPSAVVGRAFQVVPTVSGAQGQQSWSLYAGVLPDGLALDTATGRISGTPTRTMTSNGLTLRVADASGSAAATNAFAITVAPSPQVLSASIAATLRGSQGSAFSAYPSVTGASGAMTWRLTTGTLPAGLTLDAPSGHIGGTPTATGTSANLVLTVTDASGATAQTNPFLATIDAGGSAAMSASIGTPIPAQVGYPVFAYPSVSGATGATTWRLAGGQLPAGLAVDAATGRISGSPTQAGAVGGIALTVVDAANSSATTNPFSIAVQPANGGPVLSADIASFLAGQVGVAFNAAPTGSGFSGTPAWSLAAGALPDGLSLNAASGRITGTPTGEGRNTGLRLALRDGSGSVATTPDFTLAVAPASAAGPLAVSPTGDLAAYVSVAYGFTPSSTGGSGARTWRLTSGILPPGLALSQDTGTISGTPTQASSSAGLRLTVTDAAGTSASGDAFALTVTVPTIAVSTVPAMTATYGTRFTSANPSVVSGTAPVTWSLASGNLPSWATLNASTGGISGTPDATGTATLRLSAKDATGASASSNAFTLTVARPALSVTKPTGRNLVHSATAVAPLSPTATGLIGTPTWSLAGTLPPGLGFDPSTGTISGTPTTIGGFDGLSLTLRDAFDGATATGAPFAFDIVGAPSIFVSSSYPARRGLAFAAVPTVTNEVGTTSWTLASGTLPAWMTLDGASGTLSGTPPAIGQFGPFTLRTTDSSGAVATSAAFTVDVTASFVASTSKSTYSGRVGMPFTSGGATAAGQSGSVTWSMASGSLPAWATLNPSTGTISGTPDAAASLALSLTATDAQGISANTATFTLAVTPQPTLTANSVSVRVGAATSVTIGRSGTVGSTRWTLTGGTLPNWAVLDAASGTISGIPSAVGTAQNLSVTVVDADGATATSPAFTIAVTAGLDASNVPATIPGRQGQPLSAALPTPGGVLGTLSWSVQSGHIPNGLTLQPGGTLTGTPTESGTFPVILQARDSYDGAVASASTSVALSLGLQVFGTSDVAVHVSVSGAPSPFSSNAPGIVGQRGTVSWTLASGTLPDWATLDAATGIIAGTAPTATASIAGLSLLATDGLDKVTATSGVFSLTVVGPLDIVNMATAYTGRFGFAFASTVPTLSNRQGTASWAWGPASPPAWAKLSAATGQITGTPDALGVTGGLTVVATDGTGSSRTSTPFSLTVYSQPAVTVDNTALKIRVGDAPHLVPTVTGIAGKASWTATIRQGALPDGLTIDPSSGGLTGSPTTSGSAVFVLTVKDSLDGTTADSQPISLTVSPAMTLATASNAYRVRTGSFLATDLPAPSGQQGSVSYRLSIAVPSGMQFDAQSGVLSGVPTVALDQRTVTVTATDSYDLRTAQANYTLTIQLPLAASGTRDVAIRNGADASLTTFVPSASNLFLAGSVTWVVTSGVLPNGVTLDGKTGKLTGVPTGYPATTVFGPIQIAATDTVDNASAGAAAFRVTVNPTLSVTLSQGPLTLRTGASATTAQPGINGAVGTPTWSIVTAAGTAPQTVSVGSNGVVALTASTPGSWSFKLRALDPADGTTADGPTVTLVTNAVTSVTYQSNIAPGPGQSISLFPTVQHSLGALSYLLGSGTLPAGLQVEPTSGSIYGSTSVLGTNVVTVQATDTDGAVTVSNPVRIAVTNNPDVYVPTPTAAKVGRPYALAASVSNASTYTWAFSGTLPTGLAFNTTTGAISGSPTQTGTFPNLTVSATDTTRSLTATSTPFSISVASGNQVIVANGAAWRQGLFGSLSLSVSNAVGNVAWSTLSGALPPGLSVVGSALQGTPTGRGTFAAVLQATDSEGSVASVPLSIVVAPGPVVSYVTRTFYPGDTVAMSANVSGITGTPAFDVYSGTLPSGLALSPTTGAITGTAPQSAAPAAIAVRVTDSDGTTGISSSFTLAVSASSFVIDVATTTAGQIAQAYTLQPNALLRDVALNQSVTWGISSRLPQGLQLDILHGTISGTPTEIGTFTFRLTAAYNGQNASSALVTLAIADRPALSASFPSTSVSARLGAAFALAPTAQGSVGNTQWSVASGTLPTGLGLAPVTGQVTGTPSAAGTFTFALLATDASKSATTPAVTVTVATALTASVNVISSVSRVGAAYLANGVANGAVGTVRWTLATGQMPPGFTLDPNSGTFSGALTAVGQWPFTLQVRDSTGATATTPVTVNVTPGPSIAVIPDQTTATNASFTLTPTTSSVAGTPTWSMSGGLQTGLGFSTATGAITGTPSVSSTLSGLTLTVRDGDGLSVTSNPFTLTTVTSAVLAIAAPNEVKMTRGQAVSAQPTTTGANGAVRYELQYVSGNSSTAMSTGATSGAYSLASYTPNLAGLSFDMGTGRIYGTPTVLFSSAILKVKAIETRTGGLTATSNQIVLLETDWPAPAVTYPTSAQGPRNAVLANIVPVSSIATGSTVRYQLQFYDVYSSASGWLDFASTSLYGGNYCLGGSAAATTGSFALNAYNSGQANCTSYDWSLTAPFAGLSFNMATGVISGTPTLPFANAQFRVTLFETRQGVTLSTNSNAFTITTTDYAPPTVTMPVSAALTRGVAMTAVGPSVTGATGTLRYELQYVSGASSTAISSGAASGAFNLALYSANFAGLSFDMGTGKISGTPTAQFGTATFKVAVYEIRNGTTLSATSNQISLVETDWPAPTVSVTPSNVGLRYAAIATVTPVPANVLPTSTVRYQLQFYDVYSSASGWLDYASTSLYGGNYCLGGSAAATTGSFALNAYNSGVANCTSYDWSLTAPFAGLSFNMATGAISGTPTLPFANAQFRVTMFETRQGVTLSTNSNAFTLTTTDYAPPTVTMPVSAALTRGVAMTAVGPSVTGATGTLRYELQYVSGASSTAISSGAASGAFNLALYSANFAGLSFDMGTGKLSGTPTALFGAATFKVAVYEIRNGTTLTATSNQIDLIEADWAAPTLSYATSTVAQRFAAMASIVPAPLNVVSTSAVRYQLQFYDVYSSASGWLDYASTSLYGGNYCLGGSAAATTGSFALNAYNSGQANCTSYDWSLTAPFAGLSFNMATGVISGTPSLPFANAQFRVTMFETRQGVTLSTNSNAFTLTTTDYVPPTVTMPVSAALTRGVAMTTVGPSVTGATGTLRYELQYVSGASSTAISSGAASGAFNLALYSASFAGLSFDMGTGKISGTPTAQFGTAAFKVAVYEIRNGTTLSATSNQISLVEADWPAPTLSYATSVQATRYAAMPAITPVTSIATGSTVRYQLQFYDVYSTASGWLDYAGTSLYGGNYCLGGSAAATTGSFALNAYNSGQANCTSYDWSLTAPFAGLSFNMATGAISGTPTLPFANAQFRVTMFETRQGVTLSTNSNAFTLTTTDYAPPTVSMPVSAALTRGVAMTAVGPSVTGATGTLRYELQYVSGASSTAISSGAASGAFNLALYSANFAGLSFDMGTGKLSGTPTALFGAATFKVAVYEIRNGTTLTATSNQISLVEADWPAPTLSYATSVQATRYAAVPSIVPVTSIATGSTVRYQLQFYDVYSSASGWLDFASTSLYGGNYCLGGSAAATTGSFALNAYNSGQANCTSYDWSLTAPFAGLSFNMATGVISGTPTLPFANAQFRVTMFETRQGVTLSTNSNAFTITTTDYAPPTVSILNTLSGVQNQAIQSLYPQVVGATGSVRYELQSVSGSTTTVLTSGAATGTYALSGGNANWAGLSFDLATGILSGTPTKAFSNAAFKVKVYETRNTVALNATSNEVVLSVTASAQSIPVTYGSIPAVVGTSFSASPTLNGATATSYALTFQKFGAAGSAGTGETYPAALPAWLTFSTTTGVISGTVPVGTPGTTAGSGSPNAQVYRGMQVCLNGGSTLCSDEIRIAAADRPLPTLSVAPVSTVVNVSATSPAVTSNVYAVNASGTATAPVYGFVYGYNTYNNGSATGPTDTQILAASGKPAWITLDTTSGAVTANPPINTAGRYRGLQVCVVDGQGYKACSAEVVVTVTNRQGMALAHASDPLVQTVVGTPFSLAAPVLTGNAVGAVTYALIPQSVTSGTSAGPGESVPTTVPTWLVVNPATGALSGTVPIGTPGTTPGSGSPNALTYRGWTIKATDSQGFTASSTEVRIAAADRPLPTLSVAPVSTVVNVSATSPAVTSNVYAVNAAGTATAPTYGFVYGYNTYNNGSATGPTDTQILAASGKPAWITLDTTSGYVTAIPPINTAGRYRGLQVCVVDGQSYKACSAEVVVTVTNRQGMALAHASDPLVQTVVGVPFSLAAPVLTGNAVGAVTYALIPQSVTSGTSAGPNESIPTTVPGWLAVNPATGALSGTVPIGTPGTTPGSGSPNALTYRGWTIKATDSQGFTASSAEVRIAAADRPLPTLSVAPVSTVVNVSATSPAIVSALATVNTSGAATAPVYGFVYGYNTYNNGSATGPTDTQILAASGKPAWITLDTTSGYVTANPPINTTGRYRGLQVCVVDGQGYKACSGEVVVTVTNRQGMALAHASDPLVPTVVGVPFTLAAPVLTGNAVGAVTYALIPQSVTSGTSAGPGESIPTTVPAWLVVNPATGALSGTVPIGTPGTTPGSGSPNALTYRGWTIKATDSQGFTASSAEVRIAAADRVLPTLDAPGYPQATVNKSYQIVPVTGGYIATANASGTATAPVYSLNYAFGTYNNTSATGTGDVIITSASAKPSWMPFDTTTGIIAGTPPLGSAQRYRGLQVCVVDGQGYKACTGEVVLTVGDRAPMAITTPVPTQTTVGTQFTIPGPTVTNAIGAVSYALLANSFGSGTSAGPGESVPTANPAWMSFDPNSGTITGTVPYGTPGATAGSGSPNALTYRGWTIKATDSLGTPVSTGEVIIQAADRVLPTLSMPPVTNAQVNVPLSATPSVAYVATANATGSTTAPVYSFVYGYNTYANSGATGSGDTLILAAASKPAWITLNPATGVVSISPTAGTAGRYRGLQVCVVDGLGYKACSGEVTITVSDRAMLGLTVNTVTDAPLTQAFTMTPGTSNSYGTVAYTLEFQKFGSATAASTGETYPSAIPAWMSFDTTSGKIYGTAPTGTTLSLYRGMRIKAVDSQTTAYSTEVTVRVR